MRPQQHLHFWCKFSYRPNKLKLFKSFNLSFDMFSIITKISYFSMFKDKVDFKSYDFLKVVEISWKNHSNWQSESHWHFSPRIPPRQTPAPRLSSPAPPRQAPSSRTCRPSYSSKWWQMRCWWNNWEWARRFSTFSY